jgi:hypothetical protein
MYVIKNMKNKQKEWHPATKPLPFNEKYGGVYLPGGNKEMSSILAGQ